MEKITLKFEEVMDVLENTLGKDYSLPCPNSLGVSPPDSVLDLAKSKIDLALRYEDDNSLKLIHIVDAIHLLQDAAILIRKRVA